MYDILKYYSEINDKIKSFNKTNKQQEYEDKLYDIIYNNKGSELMTINFEIRKILNLI